MYVVENNVQCICTYKSSGNYVQSIWKLRTVYMYSLSGNYVHISHRMLVQHCIHPMHAFVFPPRYPKNKPNGSPSPFLDVFFKLPAFFRIPEGQLILFFSIPFGFPILEVSSNVPQFVGRTLQKTNWSGHEMPSVPPLRHATQRLARVTP